ncbi:FHA domain-containing protein [Calothrix sp. UHCC 0171]|uniref:FHA domain-containing protein n=1 Tax=Calothrix sp. UHCC 0171 TaxID=3110245 RepID=UPI002B209279|nr:FHA domain-containing protein [Calothrix sp. UHCC 0171]MEA5572388.1 FHA domain-containing protein [Calothrix sp. UHCC 0171]
MYELTLEWHDKGKTIVQKVIVELSRKQPPSMIFGRNPECNIILNPDDTTCSRLQAEIIFKSQEKNFYLRKHTKASRPAIVDSKIINDGEVLLCEGSLISLGKTEIRVTSISQSLQYMIICSNIKCLNPHPHHALDAKYLYQHCPWCGSFLTDAATYLPTLPEGFLIRPIDMKFGNYSQVNLGVSSQN